MEAEGSSRNLKDPEEPREIQRKLQIHEESEGILQGLGEFETPRGVFRKLRESTGTLKNPPEFKGVQRIFENPEEA